MHAILSSVFKWWSSVSIVKKLYLVIGIMAVLIASELVVLRFAMRTLSASRAFVEGESLWSKNQKSAVSSLLRYVQDGDDRDYHLFENHLKIPGGDHQARLELQKPSPNLEIVRQGFAIGQNHPADIEPMIDLLRRFYWISYLQTAISAWTKADLLIAELENLGIEHHNAVAANKKMSRAEINSLRHRIASLDDQLTPVESEFSYALGQGCRWLEYVVVAILTIVVLTVESFGLTLAVMISRHLSRGLSHLGEVTRKIGHGDFSAIANVDAMDEIGQLATGINAMGALLKDSYGELEERVKTRTQELKRAVETRDEFLSIASHELKTPLTSLYLQIQMMVRAIDHHHEGSGTETISDMAKRSYEYATRMILLIDKLFDLTQLRIGNFVIKTEICDVVLIVRDIVLQMSEQAKRGNTALILTGDSSAIGTFDGFRIGEVAMNFISNAIKYGGGSQIEVSVAKVDRHIHIAVRDHGKGISVEDQQRIFTRFDRGNPDPGVSGLGLGLYISNEIVKAHNGEIKLESQVGVGSKFTAILPVS